MIKVFSPSVEKVSEKSKELLEKISTLQDKLELATGIKDPNYVQLQAFAEGFERLQKLEKASTPVVEIVEAVPSEKSTLAKTLRPKL